MNVPPNTGVLTEYTRNHSPKVAWIAWWTLSDELRHADRSGLLKAADIQAETRRLRRDVCAEGGPMGADELRRTVHYRDGREETLRWDVAVRNLPKDPDLPTFSDWKVPLGYLSRVRKLGYKEGPDQATGGADAGQ